VSSTEDSNSHSGASELRSEINRAGKRACEPVTQHERDADASTIAAARDVRTSPAPVEQGAAGYLGTLAREVSIPRATRRSGDERGIRATRKRGTNA
jgi:hypothetical protein